MSADLPEIATFDLVSAREPGTNRFSGAALDALEGTVLPAFLPLQRWFADKGTALEAVRLVDLVALDEAQQAFLAIVEIAHSRRMYFVPLAICGETTTPAIPAHAILARIRDNEGLAASRDAALCDGSMLDLVPQTLLADMRAERRRRSVRGGFFAAHAAPLLTGLDASAQTPVRRLSVEQSNTSIVLGERMMLKLYRRIHRGAQPELEIARFLDTVHFANTPALLGYVEYEFAGEESAALCILQRFVASEGDGWSATLRYLDGALTATDFVGCGDATDGAARHASFAHRMRTLGKRTAELHRAFATPIGDPAFEPEPTTAADVGAWIAQARATAETALAALEREGERVPPELRPRARARRGRRAEIAGRLSLAAGDLAAVSKTRYHGDYHLGQVLAVGDDFMIVDFEGEPGRDHAVRRRKSSPLRDVAGMVRSLDYAAVAGARGVRVNQDERFDALEAAARAWKRVSVAAFLDGYRAAVAGCASYPQNPDLAQRLLDLFTLEKAFYEMSYELANRPAWLHIPLEGISAILDAGQHAISVE